MARLSTDFWLREMDSDPLAAAATVLLKTGGFSELMFKVT